MDFSKLMARVMAILSKPKTEWAVIAGESTTTGALYSKYIVWLAAIPPVFGFIRNSLMGYAGIGSGLGRMILTYAMILILVYVVALIVNALAGSFDAQKSQIQALKTVAYAYTAAWIAGAAVIIPGLGTLIALVGSIYSIYLLYLGLPHTMKCPREKAGGYTAVTVIITLLLGMVLGWLIIGSMFASGAHMAGGMFGATGSDSAHFDKDSRLGKLQAMSERMQEASKKMEAAQKSGDTKASSEALGTMMAAMSGSKKPVEALSTDQIKSFLPESVNGLDRTSISAERNMAMGMQIAQARAEYTSKADDDGNRGRQRLRLEVMDSGGAKAILGMAGMFGHESEKQTENGFERSYSKDGQMFEEKWDGKYKRGKYAVVIGGRFKVEANGDADSFDDLKRAVASVDLQRLASLKDSGVTQ